jgi:hypothetical protein
VRHIALVGALVVGIVAVPATTGSARPTRNTPAAPTVVHHATTKAHTLATPGLKTIESISLTAGNWSIFAKATAIDPSGGDFFRCTLVATSPTTQLDGATTSLNPTVTRDVITNITVFKTKHAVTIQQRCGHDVDGGDAGSIDAGASVVAFLTPATRVRTARTTAQTPLPNREFSGVANLSLPKGNWVVVAKVTPVDLTGSEGVDLCRLGSAPDFQRVLGPSASGDHGVSTMVQVQPISVSTTTTFTLECEAATDGNYLDPGSVLWAWKATHLASATSAAPNQCPLTLSAAATSDALVLNQQVCDVGNGSFPTEIAGAHLDAGTWVALGAFDDLWPRDPNVVRCQLLNASKGKQFDVSSAALQYPGFSTTGITNLGVVVVPKHVDIEARCGQDGAGDPAVSAESGWGFIKP